MYETHRKIPALWSLFHRVATLTICFYLLQGFFKRQKGVWNLSPDLIFSMIFEENISHILLTDQMLFPGFEKLHKVHRKIPVKFLRTPLLQNICRQLLLNKLGTRSQFFRGFQLPVFKVPTPLPSLSPLFKIFVSLPSFLLYPILRYFRQFHQPQATPFCHNPTNQTSLVYTNIERVALPVQLLLSIKNRFLIF